MELLTTAGKETVGVTRAVNDEKENSIAVILDQEIDALQINYTTVASDIEMDEAPIKALVNKVHCQIWFHQLLSLSL